MHRRIWLSVAALAVGAALLVAAGVAAPSANSKSGSAASSALRKNTTLRINIAGTDVDSIDPQIAYGTTSWNIEYVTALKLLNFPDARAPKGAQIRNEAAARYTISKNGKVYTFFLKKGLRFSDGSKVTAANFAYAINRSLDKDLQSPAFQFVSAPTATNVIGAQAVRDGKARNAAGVKASGLKLTIRLTRPNPAFLSQLTMPFFQATSTKLSRTKEVIGVSGNALPSAGPYYVSAREPNRSITLKRNKFYKGGRPHNASTINFTMNVNLEAGFNQVDKGEVDYQEGIPPAEHASLNQRFGKNKSRYWVYPGSCVSYMALNNNNQLFRGNVKLRKAVNYVINRTAMVNQYGLFGGITTDQILPPLIRGYKKATIYPAKPNLSKARSLARGATRNGKGILYHGLTPPGPQVAEIVRNSMKAIGIDIETRGYRGFAIYDAAGRKGADFAATVGTGWCKDYPDPYDYINVLLDGTSIQEENNNNLAYFNNKTYNRRMANAAKLVGAKRYSTYGQLDIDITRNQAPWASWRVINNRFFIAAKVNPKSFVYQPAYENPDYAVMTLK